MIAISREQVDPFANDIVSEPRQIERTIDSLNRSALNQVLREFRRLAAQPVPRLGPPRNAVVVLSPEPGYGKSHLIGRLFRELDDDATLIYLRPYQDPASCWIGVLERVVTELNYPDDSEALAVRPGELTQLDTLARRVLVHVTTKLLESGDADVAEPQKAREFFARYPNAVFETPEWRSWLEQSFERLLPKLDALLAAAAVHLRPSRQAWLRVLFKYAFSEDNYQVRQTCLEWLRHEELDPEDARQLGLTRAEAPDLDIPYEQRNERCFERVRDLFVMGAFYRPFLVCFDQTELYGKSESLARSLGVVLSRLRREAKNHLLVVTGNEFVWEDQVFNRFEKADQDGCADPIHLEGVQQAEARALVLQRLEDWEVPRPEAERFADSLMSELFVGEKAMHSARHVLREACRRWRNPPPATPRSLFEVYRQRLLADPKRLDFDSGVLHLVSERILGPAVGASVQPFRSKRGYLTLEWVGKDCDALLGFQPGSHWKTWESIARESHQYCEARKHGGRRTVAAFFRTAEQKRLPERARSLIQETESINLLALERADAAALYAAHELLADVQQGNQEIELDSLLAFLREELKGYATRLLRPDVPDPDPPVPDVSIQIRAIVEKLRFVTPEHLAQRLRSIGSEITKDQVLEQCSKLSDCIRVFTSPNSVMLRWYRSTST